MNEATPELPQQANKSDTMSFFIEISTSRPD